MEQTKKKKTNLSTGITRTITVALVSFGILVIIIGAFNFWSSISDEYTYSTYNVANTAVAMVDGDHIEDYLAEKRKEEYLLTKENLNVFCHRMSVTLVYVISVDTSDYNSFDCVFNCVNNTVGDTNYEGWELGFHRYTTNEEYRRKYEALYNKESEYETVYRLFVSKGYKPHITTIVPVRDSQGDVSALLCVQRPIRELTDAIVPYVLSIVFFVILLCFIVFRRVTAFINLHFILPVEKVSAEATRFARTKTKEEPLGSISRYTELSSLASSIDTMETDMVSYMEELTEVTAERERSQAEMSLAKGIQESSIPNTFPAFPDRKDFDIYASMTPARAVGGDFYNYLLIDDDHLAVIIGDVSGKGVPAALFMMASIIVLSDRARMGGSPSEILTFANENISRKNAEEMFVTTWLGILEISTGRFVGANAGHEDMLICPAGGSFEMYRTKHGLAVGAMPGVRYKDFEIQMKKGDRIFIYTDGIPEATDKEYNMFGEKRMTESLNRHKDGDLKELLEGVHRDVDAFADGAPQFDDLTMLCLEYRGPDDGSGKIVTPVSSADQGKAPENTASEDKE